MAGDEKLDAILEERGNNYGPFSGHAAATQSMMRIIKGHLVNNPRYEQLELSQRDTLNEGLHMIAHKIGRIVNGDPTYKDSWDDIAGYARITGEFLNGK